MLESVSGWVGSWWRGIGCGISSNRRLWAVYEKKGFEEESRVLGES